MEYLKVKNWDEFQHYKDRNPPWIKLYHSILDDYEYGCLQDDSKLLLLSFFLLASRTNNRIPNDPDWIKKKAMLSKKPDVQPLVNIGFLITCNHNGSEMLATCKQSADPETETETEKSREEKNISASDDAALKVYTTKKGKKLKGQKLEWFSQFWEVFGYKKGKAEAADSWYDIKDFDEHLFKKILNAAKQEKINRKEIIKNGKIPKMAQGWLSSRRWEDEIYSNESQEPKHVECPHCEKQSLDYQVRKNNGRCPVCDEIIDDIPDPFAEMAE